MIKPHVKYWKHGMWFCEGDGIISAGFTIPHAIIRWKNRWLAMESVK